MPVYNIEVVIDPTQGVAGARKVKEAIQGTGTAADKAGALIRRAFLFAGGAAGLTSAIRTIASFSQEMSTVKAITNATGAEFKSLSDKAKELGANTRYSATQAAQSMVNLARAGFDTSKVIESVDDTLVLAQAGALDLASAANITAGVLSGFRLQTTQAAHVTDVLAAAANSAKTDVSQLGDATKYVAPVAAGMGVSLEEATAAIGALSDSALDGSMAGTGLRRILSELEAPASASRKILAGLGLTADDVKVSEVGLTQALKTLAEAGLDTGMALQMFGDRGGPAFEILANSIPKVEALTDKFKNVDGYARNVANVMDDNLNGALLSVKSAIESVILAFGQLGAESALTKFFRGLATVIRGISANIDIFGRAVIGLAGAFATLTIIRTVTSLVQGLTAAIAANPIGALAVALTAATALLVSFSDEIVVGSNGITTLRDYGVAAFQLIKENIGPVITLLKEGFSQALAWITDGVNSFGLSWGDVFTGVKWYINHLIGFYYGLLKAGQVIFSKMRELILAALGSEVAQEIVNSFKVALNWLIDQFNRLSEFVSGVLRKIGVAIGELGSVAGIEIAVPAIPKGIKDFGSDVKDAFLSGFETDFVGKLSGVVMPAFKAVQERADALAQRREAERAKEAERAAAEAKAPTVAPAAVVTPPTRPKGLDAEVRAIIENLRKEGEALRMTNAEREIAEGLLEAEKSLKRDLVPSEKALVEEQLRLNQSLQAQADVLQQIRGPVEEYKNTQTALNALLAEGAISAAQYNTALSQTQLAQGLQGIKAELPGGEGDAELQALQEQQAARTEILRQAMEARLINEQEYLELSRQINEQYNQDVMRYETARFQTQLRQGQSIFNSLGQITKQYAGEQSGLYQVMFRASKAFAIADSTVKIIQGIADAAANPWPANLAAMASVAAATAGLVGQIQGTNMQGFENGGSFRVGGAGGPDSQMVQFRASPNETVSIKTPGQEKQAQAAPVAEEPQPINVINVTDPNMLENYLNTPAGERLIVNTIQRNGSQVSRFFQRG